MRGFFFLLLLTNLALVAWQYFEQRGQTESINIYRGIPLVNNGLALISELPKDERPPLREGEEEIPSADEIEAQFVAETEDVSSEQEADLVQSDGAGEASALMCYRIGSIESKAELNALVKRLAARGAEVLEQGQAQGTKNSYWVVLPAYRNRKKANEAAEILARRRVKDFFIVRSGEHENAISLGVFSTKERAERRYDEIANLKARLRKPVIEILELPDSSHYIVYRMNSLQKTKSILSYLERTKSPPAEKINCK